MNLRLPQVHKSLNVINVQASKAYKLSKLAVDLGIAKTVTKKSDKYIGSITFDTLKDLGPTFIKIGQFISTRSDIFGNEFTDELKGLQDNVSPMAHDDIQYLISLVSSQFESIDETPIAAASIGQVHCGVLKDGRKAAIKFKRRNIDQTINNDFQMLLMIIDFIKVFVSHRQVTEIEISLREYYNLLLEEIDFKNEVKNMKSFKQQFKNTPWIKVPTPYEDICTNDIIVMEYVPAIKINDTTQLRSISFNTVKVAEKLLECFFTQVVQYGFVHIDPHPGNVGMTKEGQIVFYDYGMFVTLDGVLKDNIKSLFIAMYDRDIEDVCNILIDLKIIIVEPSKVPSFKRFIASFLTYIDNLDIDNFKIAYLDKIDQSQMQFLISSKFILLLRGITIMEGICKTLHPDFNYRDILDPFISDFIIDIEYFERKGNKDISRFRNVPDKVITSEISLGMVESDIDVLKKKLSTSDIKNKVLLTSMLLMGPLQTLHYTDSVEAQVLFASAFIYVLFN